MPLHPDQAGAADPDPLALVRRYEEATFTGTWDEPASLAALVGGDRAVVLGLGDPYRLLRYAAIPVGAHALVLVTSGWVGPIDGRAERRRVRLTAAVYGRRRVVSLLRADGHRAVSELDGADGPLASALRRAWRHRIDAPHRLHQP